MTLLTAKSTAVTAVVTSHIVASFSKSFAFCQWIVPVLALPICRHCTPGLWCFLFAAFAKKSVATHRGLLTTSGAGGEFLCHQSSSTLGVFLSHLLSSRRLRRRISVGGVEQALESAPRPRRGQDWCCEDVWASTSSDIESYISSPWSVLCRRPD